MVLASLALSRLAGLSHPEDDEYASDEASDEDDDNKGSCSCEEEEEREDAAPSTRSQMKGAVRAAALLKPSVPKPSAEQRGRSLRPQRKVAPLTVKWNLGRGPMGNLLAAKATTAAAHGFRAEVRNHPAVVEQLNMWWELALQNFYAFPRNFEFKPDVPIGEVRSTQ